MRPVWSSIMWQQHHRATHSKPARVSLLMKPLLPSRDPPSQSHLIIITFQTSPLHISSTCEFRDYSNHTPAASLDPLPSLDLTPSSAAFSSSQWRFLNSTSVPLLTFTLTVPRAFPPLGSDIHKHLGCQLPPYSCSPP